MLQKIIFVVIAVCSVVSAQVYEDTQDVSFRITSHVRHTTDVETLKVWDSDVDGVATLFSDSMLEKSGSLYEQKGVYSKYVRFDSTDRFKVDVFELSGKQPIISVMHRIIGKKCTQVMWVFDVDGDLEPDYSVTTRTSESYKGLYKNTRVFRSNTISLNEDGLFNIAVKLSKDELKPFLQKKGGE